MVYHSQQKDVINCFWIDSFLTKSYSAAINMGSPSVNSPSYSAKFNDFALELAPFVVDNFAPFHSMLIERSTVTLRLSLMAFYTGAY
jgi:hypothetical protein